MLQDERHTTAMLRFAGLKPPERKQYLTGAGGSAALDTLSGQCASCLSYANATLGAQPCPYEPLASPTPCSFALSPCVADVVTNKALANFNAEPALQKFGMQARSAGMGANGNLGWVWHVSAAAGLHRSTVDERHGLVCAAPQAHAVLTCHNPASSQRPPRWRPRWSACPAASWPPPR